MKISVLEQVKINSDLYRKEREEFYIRKFDTLNEGMNRKIWVVWSGGGLSILLLTVYFA